MKVFVCHRLCHYQAVGLLQGRGRIAMKHFIAEDIKKCGICPEEVFLEKVGIAVGTNGDVVVAIAYYLFYFAVRKL